mmetsp:Transcript_1849/g.1644  ORF Transcript_1849/g.1644 Transcript_1849/m.1644 type:complete len:232 (-) Transcript_1849:300-995(-)
MQTTSRISLKKSRNFNSGSLKNLPFSPRLMKTQHNFKQYLKNENLETLFTKVTPLHEKQRKKDRKLLLKYDLMYKRMKEKEIDIFKNLSIQINKIVNTEKERYLFLKNNQPSIVILEPKQKYYFNIRIFQKNPPLRVFLRPQNQGNYTLYVSRKINKPYIEENSKIYKNPYKILVKGSHDEGVFLTESAFFTLEADTRMQLTLGYCFNHQVPAKALLPDYHMPDFESNLKT